MKRTSIPINTGTPTSAGTGATESGDHLQLLITPIAPPDRIHLVDAISGLMRCVTAAQRQGALPSGIQLAAPAGPQRDTPPIGALARERRAVAYRTYWLLTKIGQRMSEKITDRQSIDLATLGVRVVSTALGQTQPTHSALKHLDRSLFTTPDSMQSQLMRLRRATSILRNTVSSNPATAMAIGLIPTHHAANRTDDEQFDQRLYRRRRPQGVLGSMRERAGAHRHNNLTEQQLLALGRQLKGQLSNDTNCLFLALSIETGLLPGDLVYLPISSSQAPPPTAAWLDLETGHYVERLPRRERDGQKPLSGTEGLYTVAHSAIRKPLSEECLMELRRRCSGTRPQRVRDILGPYTLPPKAGPLNADSLGPITPRRAMSSIHRPLIDRQHDRYIVSLVTGRRDLVPEHRLYYGTVSCHYINASVRATHRLLGWTTPPSVNDSGYVGSAVEPTDEALKNAWRCLHSNLPQRIDDTLSTSDAIAAINEGNALFAFGLAFALALRPAKTYAIQIGDIASTFPAFSDKRTQSKPRPLVVNGLARAYAAQWQELCADVIEVLLKRGATEAKLIADHLRDAGALAVFEIRAGRIYARGHQIWQSRLPSRHRLIANFGRHYWPRRLTERGLKHEAIEALLRHSGGVYMASATSPTSDEAIRSALSQEMLAIARHLNIDSLRAQRSGT
jgi:hypothetical protein